MTSGTGVLPDNWKVNKGGATVEEFECGTKPDIFSLRIQPNNSGEMASITRKIVPVNGKIVWESRFLLPKKIVNLYWKL